MARFLYAVAGLLLLVALTTEATTKTIITSTTMEDMENPTGRQTGMPMGQCMQQMMQQQMLNHCMMYLDTATSGMSTGRGPMSQATPEQHLELCCTQLTNMDEMCRCDAIKMMMNQQGWTQQQMGQMMGMAQNLPSKCNLPPQMCQMKAVWF